VDKGEQNDLIKRLRRAEWRGRLRSYALIAPLFVFVALSFLMPLGSVLLNSVYDPVVPDGLPRTFKALADWNGRRGDQVPPEPVFAALALDLEDAARAEKSGPIGGTPEHRRNRPAQRVHARSPSRQRPGAGPRAPSLKTPTRPGPSPPSGAPSATSHRASTHAVLPLRLLDMKRQSDGQVVLQARRPAHPRCHLSCAPWAWR